MVPAPVPVDGARPGVLNAQKWLCKHGFVWDSKVDIKPNFIRFSQIDPSRYKKYRIKPTVELVIGFKK